MTSAAMFNGNDDEIRRFDITTSDDDGDHKPSLSSSSSMEEQHTPPLIDKDEIFNDKNLNKLLDNWIELDTELRAFVPKHKEYVRKLDEVESLKTKYKKEFDNYKKKIFQLQKDVAHLQKTYVKKG
jgi:hypothetical protein